MTNDLNKKLDKLMEEQYQLGFLEGRLKGYCEGQISIIESLEDTIKKLKELLLKNLKEDKGET